MKKQIGAIILVLIVWTLFMAENVSAQTKCKLVNLHMTNYIEDYGVEACGDEAWCGEGNLIGTLDGRLFTFGLDSESLFYPFGDALFWKGKSTIETKDGDIFSITSGVNLSRTWWTSGVSTSQESHAVTGGTGRYAGASGYFLMNYIFGNWDGNTFITPTTGELTGQVCWPQ